MKALIHNNLVVDIAEEEFPVHKDFTWMEAPEGCEAGTHGWGLVDGVLVAPPPEPDKTYDEIRRKNYPLIGDQLDDLYHEGGAFSSAMTAKLKAVKDKWPKDNSGPQDPADW